MYKRARSILKKIIAAVFGLFLLLIPMLLASYYNKDKPTHLREIFTNPPQSAKPWVFWYWMHGAVTKEGITADLTAMKEAGIGGAYLMPIKDVTDPPLIENPVRQLTPEWWAMVKHAMNEAKRLGLQMAMHASDGFAVAGGPWITPELSMQKIVWTEKHISGIQQFKEPLEQPETIRNYYQDLAVYAYPTPEGAENTSYTITPVVTSSKPEIDVQFLTQEENKESFSSDEPAWIQYRFDQPFLCRSITIKTQGNNHQSRRLEIQVSQNGKDFRSLGRMESPRYGWQDNDEDITYAIEPVEAKYFRFVYDPSGTEPGAEDLDAAKWKPSLKIIGIVLSGAPKIHQYEGKSGAVWRIARWTTSKQVPDSLCPSLDNIIDLTHKMDSSGVLTWNVPEGEWTILRIGHTSTGHTNYTGGGGLGLECDKFNPEAVKLQFDKWFGEATRQIGQEMTGEILKIFHVDSWECGSQNWSPVFRDEFIKRRGYDPLPYLPIMTGLPMNNAAFSEKFLLDIRETIAELVHDNFFKSLHRLATEKGCSFSAECVAPTMTSDGMLHYSSVDIPMGEFWLRSPTHDKMNDMLDAISGAHIYGKNLVQAEGFTEIRMDWDEHPAMIKALGDRNYALGANKMVYHVFTHNPWLDRKPGMTLDRIGLYFQRDQTWWKPGRAWIEYAQRCQALLQQGKPVADIAVFTGEEVPRRSITPDRLVPILPGIFGEEIVQREKERLANIGQPLRELPAGVTHSANIFDASDWIDPLRGYAYDSFNKDALLRLAKVNNGRIELPGGPSYQLLVIPGKRPMSPEHIMSAGVAQRLLELVNAGATIVVNDPPNYAIDQHKEIVEEVTKKLWKGSFEKTTTEHGSLLVKKVGQGRVIRGPVTAESFEGIAIQKDFYVMENQHLVNDVAWNHRSGDDFDVYFISNQKDESRIVELSLRTYGKLPELFDPVNGKIKNAKEWRIEKGRTFLPVQLAPHGSLFIVLQQTTDKNKMESGKNWLELETSKSIECNWQVKFDTAFGGPSEPVIFQELTDWSKMEDYGIKHYSGTAVYQNTFNWQGNKAEVWLDLGQVENIAEVIVNGVNCGVAWTPPYRVEISQALKNGKNQLEIEVTNTWANRLIGDHQLPEEERITWTTAPYRLEGRPLLPAGLLGPVRILTE